MRSRVRRLLARPRARLHACSGTTQLWIGRSTGVGAYVLGMVLATLFQLGTAVVAGRDAGDAYEPQFIGYVLGFAIAVIASPRGLDPIGRPSRWTLVSRAPAETSAWHRREYRRALAIVTATTVLVAVAIFGLLTGMSWLLEACFVASTLIALGWFVWAVAERRLQRRRARRRGVTAARA